MRLISRPKSIRQRIREGIIRWAKVRAEQIEQQKRADDLRQSRGDLPSASTRHTSTVLESAPSVTKHRRGIKRANKGQTQTRTKIGKRVASTIEGMGTVAKRSAQREKRGDG